MKWIMLISALVIGTFMFIITIALHPFSSELASQSIVMANDTVGAYVVASNFSYFAPMMNALPWFGILLVGGTIFFIGYTIIKGK
jgi:hypothetical protein